MISISERISLLSSLNELMNLPLSKCITKEISKFEPLLKSNLSLQKIFTNLESNHYKTIQDLKHDYNTYFNEVIKICSKDSVIGTAVYDLQTKINLVLEPKKQNTEKTKDLSAIISHLDSFITSLPNSSKEFRSKMTVGQRQQRIVEPTYPEVEEYSNAKREDIQLINDNIHHIKNDEEALEVMNIVKIFNPEAVSNNRISIYTNDLSPITVTLLRRYFTEDS